MYKHEGAIKRLTLEWNSKCLCLNMAQNIFPDKYSCGVENVKELEIKMHLHKNGQTSAWWHLFSPNVSEIYSNFLISETRFYVKLKCHLEGCKVWLNGNRWLSKCLIFNVRKKFRECCKYAFKTDRCSVTSPLANFFLPQALLFLALTFFPCWASPHVSERRIAVHVNSFFTHLSRGHL